MLLVFVGAVIGFLVAVAILVPRSQRAVATATHAARQEVYANDKDLYEKRWRSAIELLQGEGKLTEDQVKTILAPAPEAPPQLEASPTEVGVAYSQNTLYGMFSEDRRAIELARAKSGLPQFDDLKGMYSEDIRDVIKAHAKAHSQKSQGDVN